MTFSGDIQNVEDLNTVLEEINDLESEVNGKIIDDEILSTRKRKEYERHIDYILEAHKKLKDAEDLDVLQGKEEKKRIEAGINTLKSMEAKIQYAFERSDELEESD
ncbi:hypothetical protein GL218_04949 [Daldinia childiae]|uniref:uncharacterized protein n=1 Tax=Daldinia childiae TaxID=326645 RepID=UPI0014480837|nr:uncharacterized protein GL218_04949 [Daldinia childiae]KAF3059909.1 hypothetical protein GL218_04949 [Daldinia childiae]